MRGMALRFLWMWAVALAVALVAACGGGTAMKQVKVCSGLTDKCASAALPADGGKYRLAPKGALTATPHGHCVVVDVSDYQGGSLNWGEIGRYVCGGITKAGESTGYGGGSSFVHNWDGMRAAHLWHSAYWFVRPGNCTAQANLFVNRLRSVGYATDTTAGRVALDEEVPGSGLTSCIAPILYRAFHRHVDVYTSPGTNPGGSHTDAGLWQAEYGPTVHPIWSPMVLWQCSDGVYGCRTYVPGLGYTDVSHDYGITDQTVHPKPKPPPKPKGPRCFGKGWQHTKLCNSVRQQAVNLGRARDTQNGYLRVSEKNLKVVQGRIKLEQARSHGKRRKQELAYLKVSIHNQAVIQSRIKTEASKASTLNKELEALLGKYGYRR